MTVSGGLADLSDLCPYRLDCSYIKFMCTLTMFPNVSPVHRYKPSFLEHEEENLGEVLLTDSGEVFELDCDGFIISKCKLSCALPLRQDSHFRLESFYSYEPFFKYYLVLIDDTLFVVKKLSSGHLEVQKVVSSVSKFFVDDSENVGHSKLFVLYKGNSSPTVLDLYCSEINTAPRLIGNALLHARSQIEGLDARLRSAQQILNDKRMFVAKLCNQVSSIETTQEFEDSGIPLMRVLGETSPAENIIRICPISFGKLWLRVCSDSWIIGVSVSNQLERELGGFELFAASNGCVVKHTTLWISSAKDDASSIHDDHIVSSILPANAQGYVVGILNEQFPLSSRVKLPFILSYHVNSFEVEEQCHLGCVDVCLQQALSLSYCPFEKETNVSDFLSLKMICKSIKISLQTSTNEVDLKSLLVDLGFQRLDERYYICRFNCQSPLRGVLINLYQNRNPPVLTIYFRKPQQLLWILETWSGKITWKLLKHEGITRCDALNQEITTLEDFFEDVKNNSDSSLFKWMPRLLQCERQTEITFQC